MKRLLMQLSIVLVLPLVFSGLAGAQDNSDAENAHVASSVNGKHQSIDMQDRTYDVTSTEVAPGLTPEQEAALITEATTPIAPDEETETVGQITDEAAVTERETLPGETEDEEEDSEVLGVEDTADDETATLVRNILIGSALIAVLFYVFFHRPSNTVV